MDKVEISVIVIVHDVAPYLRKSLDSLLRQSIKDMEIIIVESESSDGSAEIVDEYCIKNPQKIRAVHTPLEGHGKARNIGIDMARGRYIGFVDSDDYAEPNMFAKLYETALRENADLVICDYWTSFEERKDVESITGRVSLIISNLIRKIVSYHGVQNYGYTDIKANAIMSGTTAVWNKLFKYDLLKDIRFDEDLVPEDYYFCIKTIIKSIKLAHLDVPLYHYQVRRGSTIGQLRIFRRDPFDHFESIRRSRYILEGKGREISDAYYDRAVINLFNWSIDYLHKIADLDKRRRIAVLWAQQMNNTIPEWWKRKPVRDWVGGMRSNQEILECYVQEKFEDDFDLNLEKMSRPPFRLAMGLIRLIQKTRFVK